VIDTHFDPTRNGKRGRGTCWGIMRIERPMRGERRRALTVLTEAGPHAALIANGFSRELLTAIVRDGQAIAVTTVVRDGSRKVPVSYVQITEAGRQALLDKSGTS
jgi:hypothetical protein